MARHLIWWRMARDEDRMEHLAVASGEKDGDEMKRHLKVARKMQTQWADIYVVIVDLVPLSVPFICLCLSLPLSVCLSHSSLL